MNEEATRRLLVDKSLKESGWSPVVKFAAGGRYDNCVVTEYETSTGPADYVLFQNGDPIAAVESKRLSVGPQNVLSQAQRYARGFQTGPFKFGVYRIPFVYSTNGEIFWFQDLRDPNSRSRQIAKFHTPSALREMLEYGWQKPDAWLSQNPNENQYLRDYQRDATRAVEEAIRKGRRKMLISMATGTGKTVVAISLIYRLLKSGAGRRILFLVDRRALAAQAVSAFSGFTAEPGLKFDKVYEVYSQPFRREDLEEYAFNPKRIPRGYLESPQSNLAYVYVCTIQRMRIYLFGKEGMFNEIPNESEIDEDIDKIPIPINAFDIVIADECHRGYTSTEEGKWRQVLDYFDAIKIGLTATPAAHTKAYFQEIIFRYDYPQALLGKYLVDYDAFNIHSDITMKGLFLQPGEQVGLIDTATGRETYDVLEDERAYNTSDLEQKATAPDRNRKIVTEFAKIALQQERDLGHFPKTLVFAINDIPFISHADQLVNMLRDEFNRGDSFVAKITGSPSVDEPLKKIREFRNRPQPAIAVTVDMLTTGVDIPKLENLVFLRPVKSRILFAQMLGRGTRTCDEIAKDHFSVFDCFGGTLLEYFRDTTDFTADPPSPPTRTIRAIIEAIYGNEDRDYAIRVLVKRLMRIDKSISANGRDSLSQFIPTGDIQEFARSLPKRIENDWAETMKLLRNPAFQNQLETYPRAVMTFLVADTEDRVHSEYVFRTTDGRSLKPADYLVAFEDFIKNNPDHIEALNILLQKPAQFKVKELTELRKKLAQRPEKFTEDNLRKVYRNNLADIISIVHHAIKNEPLISAEERVERAMAKVKHGKNFNPEQSQWLQYIQDHLVNNLVIEERDFRQIPFSRHGGWEKASNVFKGELSPLLEEVDLAMVSL